MARLLVVDDDPDILKVADRVLTQVGHQVFTAPDALRALELLNSALFDLMISDANMPQYSGFQLVKTVRADLRHKHLPIAMLTGLRERKDVERALKAGVDDYIVKPLDPLLLVQKVASLLERRTPEQKPEIHFTKGGPSSVAKISLSVEIEAISELGVTLVMPLNLPDGTTCDLAAEFFREWGEPVPPLRVLSSSAHPQGGTRVQLVFLGAPESFLRRIRRWIFSHGASHKAVS